MQRIRVLVVDDSAVICKIISDCFKSDPEIEICATAHSGLAALERFNECKPDVVTLDIEMPEMDGLETLRRIRATDTRTPVIMFSKFTSDGAVATLEALEIGANDFVAKPYTRDGAVTARQQVKSQLAVRIRSLGRAARGSGTTLHSANQAPSALSAPRPVDAVGIAVSTGGPKVLLQIVQHLLPELRVPIFITQHMPPVFTGLLAERLSSRGPLPAQEAGDGLAVSGGNIYIAPGDHHLEVERRGDGIVTRIHQGPHENSCRPSADVMFRSLAKTFGPNVLAIVMTGMGNDGKKGCEHLKAVGAGVIAQDQDSSIVWGMPRAVVTAGIADEVLTPMQIAARINRITQDEEPKA
jgi:two-component system chemotaxis response regulator CheB